MMGYTQLLDAITGTTGYNNLKFKIGSMLDIRKRLMPEIIRKLEAYGVNADRKTIYQDIGELKKFGLDILSQQEGRNYYYFLASRDFELAELKLLVDSVQSSKFISEHKSRELIKKIEALASDHDASQQYR